MRPGSSTIRPASTPLAVRLGQSVGQVYGSKQIDRRSGGVKTTTIAVVFMSILTVVQGRKRVEIFGRTLPMGTVLRSLAVTGLALFGALFALMSLQLTQNMPLDVALFEVVSALATVGLSTGGTSMIDEAGKVVIMVCMFVGRVGPLTLFLFLSSRSDFEPPERYAEEPVPIG